MGADLTYDTHPVGVTNGEAIRAASVVRRHVADPSERALVLEALGLVAPARRRPGRRSHGAAGPDGEAE